MVMKQYVTQMQQYGSFNIVHATDRQHSCHIKAVEDALYIHCVLFHQSWTALSSLLSGFRSMTLRLPMAFSMWRWEAFPRATDPSSSPITTSASTVSQPKIDSSIHHVPDVMKLFYFSLCTRQSHRVQTPELSSVCTFSRQVVLQHPVQLWGHAGDHAALCCGSRGRARPAGGCTSLPQRVGVRLVLHALINGNTFTSVLMEEPQSIHLVRM